MKAQANPQETPEQPWPAGVADSSGRGVAGRHEEHDSVATGAGSYDPDRVENPASRAARMIPALLSELKGYGGHFISAKIDGLKLTARNIAIYAALGVVGLIVGAGVIVTAVALVVVGIAHALGALLGNHLWLGDIIVGGLILTAVVLAVYLPLKKFFKASQGKTEQKYEGKRIQQRIEHGRDVVERAAQTPGRK